MASVLDEINTTKDTINSIDLNSLDKELQPQVGKLLSKARDALIEAGIIIQKHYQDKKASELLLQEVLSNLNESNIYNIFSEEDKQKIANQILLKPELEVLSDLEFRDVVRSKARNLPEADLVKEAYGKEDILMVGRTFSNDANETVQYQVGLEHIKQLIKTPSGYEDALALAIEKTLKDPMRSKTALLKYYGLYPARN